MLPRIFTASALLTITIASHPDAHAQLTVVYQDNFNRSNNSFLEAPWTEAEEDATSRIELRDNAFTFHYTVPLINWDRFPYAFAPLPKAVREPTISFTYTPHANERVAHYIGVMNRADGFFFDVSYRPVNGVGVLLVRTDSGTANSGMILRVLAGGNNLESPFLSFPFQLDAGKTYAVLVTYVDGVATTSISDGVNSHSSSYDFGAVAIGPLDQVFVNDLQGRVSFAAGPDEYYLRFDDFVVSDKVRTLRIDIKPGSNPNSINLGSAGLIPVAIFSAPDFDATQIDPATVTLAGARVRLIGRGDRYSYSIVDVDNDGLHDLVCHVVTAEFLLAPGESTAVLEAQTVSGEPIRGEDTIRIVP